MLGYIVLESTFKELANSVRGGEHIYTLNEKTALAVLHTKQEENERDESLFNESLKNMQDKLDDDHPELPKAKSHLGVIYREQGRHNEW